MWLALFLGTIVIGLLGKSASAALFSSGKDGQQVIDTKGYNTESWRSYLEPMCKLHNIPYPFARASIDEESGGNPCAIGEPGALGPDGNPRELGLIQLYNPDDLQLLKVSGTKMRAFCVPGKIQVMHRGRMVWTHRQDVARLLTPDEMTEQASLVVGKILQARSEAMRYATAAGLAWPEIELWRLVKLVHGLPGLVHGVLAATKQLGSAPSSWQAYRDLVESGQITLDDQTEKYRSDFAAIFNNAENATAGMDANV